MLLVDGKVLNGIHEPGDLPLFYRINSLRKLGELTANRRAGIFLYPFFLLFTGVSLHGEVPVFCCRELRAKTFAITK